MPIYRFNKDQLALAVETWKGRLHAKHLSLFISQLSGAGLSLSLSLS